MGPSRFVPTAVPRIDLTVRLYRQSPGLSSTLQNRALAEAGTVLLAALVDVHWQECTGRMSSPACHVPAGPSQIVLVTRERITCDGTPITLGEALVVPGAGSVLATVYVNCVAWLASETETDVAMLLGRVVAHELGHLMMRSAAHAHRGLMRRNWTPDEIRQNRAPDWAFTAEDVAAMRH